jgi:transposase InsO family protein
VEDGLGRIAQACRALKLARSGYYRVRKVSRSSRQVGNRVVALSRAHPRYGYRRITALLRREGKVVNAKRVARLRRAEGLQVRKRQRRLRRVGPGHAERLRATQRNEVWSWDFVADQTEAGSAFRILTLIDEHTRQCLAAHVAWSIRAQDVLRVLENVMREHGPPQHIRSDNGPEFIAYAIQDWLQERRIKTLYIKPGSPWENAYIESFHDKFRDECLKREVFGNLAEARVVIGQWRHEYNECRPHSSLGYRTPAEEAARCQTALRATPCAPFDSASPQRQTSNPRTLELYL